MNKRILKRFSSSGSLTILFFHTKYVGDILMGSPVRGIECRWGMKKNSIFDQYLALSRKHYNVQIKVAFTILHKLILIMSAHNYVMQLFQCECY